MSIEMILATIAIAVSAWTYSVELTMPDMILGKLNAWALKKMPMWLHKPLISCEKCVAGQWAIWIFLYNTIQHGWTYDLPIHIWFVLQCIFNVLLIGKIMPTKPPSYPPALPGWTPPEVLQNQHTNGIKNDQLE